MSSLTLKEYYSKKQKVDKEINKLRKKLKKTSKPVFEQSKIINEKKRTLEKKYGTVTRTKDDYSIILNNKTYNIEREFYIKDSVEEEKLYNDINELKKKIIINKLNHVFEYSGDDESVERYNDLVSEFKEKQKIYDDLVEKINEEKMIKNENIKNLYEALNNMISSIKNEISDIPKENITSENYKRVAEIYKESIVLINNIQRLKN